MEEMVSGEVIQLYGALSDFQIWEQILPNFEI